MTPDTAAAAPPQGEREQPRRTDPTMHWGGHPTLVVAAISVAVLVVFAAACAAGYTAA